MGDMKLSETLINALKTKDAGAYDKNNDGFISAWELRLARNSAFRDAKKAGNPYTKAERFKIRKETNSIFKALDRGPVDYYVTAAEVNAWTKANAKA